jgi:Lon protease-like protein
VRVITTPIPLFPLGLVLLPGAVEALHIFEPRYRAMIRDVGVDGGSFGLIAPPEGTGEAELPAGRIGCTATINSIETLPDGRANIVIMGRERFRFETYVDAGTPYRMGHVSAHDDIVEDDAARLTKVAAMVRIIAERAVFAHLIIHDTTFDASTLSAKPELLSFQVAQMLRADSDILYALLEDRSPLARLIRINSLILRVLNSLEGAAGLHARAKTNGHHHGAPPA